MRMEDAKASPIRRRQRKREELARDNAEFIALASEMMRVLRRPPDQRCMICSAHSGKPHNRGHLCADLVAWRATTKYGSPS